MSPAGATVALVEDHLAVRDGVEMVLTRAGCTVVGHAASADEGYEVITTNRPDVSIVDLSLPGEDGAGLTRRLLADDPSLRVLLYTGVEDEARLADALDCGARGFALKTGAPEDLIGAVRAVAQGSGYVDPRLGTHLLSRRTTDRIDTLSPREREVLDLLAHGLTGEQVAKRLFISPETIRTHVRNAMQKLRAHTRTHAIVLALQRGEIDIQ